MNRINNISLEIKRDPRGRKFFQKAPRVGSKKTKSLAMRDITEECQTGFYSTNYLHEEYILMQTLPFDFIYIPISI